MEETCADHRQHLMESAKVKALEGNPHSSTSAIEDPCFRRSGDRRATNTNLIGSSEPSLPAKQPPSTTVRPPLASLHSTSRSILIIRHLLLSSYSSCSTMTSSNDGSNDGVVNPPSSPKNIYKDPDDGRQRFLLELEFVQCLANPSYVNYLAQNRYFEDEAFIGYLKYLQYWQRPEYTKFIVYPHCLFFLELLQNANFRTAMAHPANKELVHKQQFYFWKNYRSNRLKHILPRPLPDPAPPAPAPAAAPPALPPAMPPTSAPSPALSPMQYVIPPGSGVTKNDMRNSGIDRRKRKKDN